MFVALVPRRAYSNAERGLDSSPFDLPRFAERIDGDRRATDIRRRLLGERPCSADILGVARRYAQTLASEQGADAAASLAAWLDILETSFYLHLPDHRKARPIARRAPLRIASASAPHSLPAGPPEPAQRAPRAAAVHDLGHPHRWVRREALSTTQVAAKGRARSLRRAHKRIAGAEVDHVGVRRCSQCRLQFAPVRRLRGRRDVTG